MVVGKHEAEPALIDEDCVVTRSISARILKDGGQVANLPSAADLVSSDDAVRRQALIASTGLRRRAGAYFELEDGTLIWADDEFPVLPVFLLETIRLADLRRAAGRVLRYWADVPAAEPLPPGHEGLSVYIADIHPDDFWPLANHYDVDDFGRFVCELVVDDAEVSVATQVETGRDLSEEMTEQIARSTASSAGAEVVEVESSWVSAVGQGWRVRVRLPGRGRNAADLVAAVGVTEAVLAATSSGPISYETAMPLLSTGYVSWLVGLPETGWLDAKSEPWDLDSNSGKIELAQDAARFANADGGILVVGASTKKVDGVDTINKVRGLAKGMLNPTRVEAVLDEHVYPPIDGLTVFKVPGSEGREVVVISLPRQLDRSKPFLVHGAIAAGRVEGRFFSIVRRRGERSIPITAREVHAWLAAGRRLLDGGD